MQKGAPQICNYDIGISLPLSLRRWLRRQIAFEIDGMRPFEPHPVENAFPVFEWGLNWCIATSAHRYMMLHAGTVAFGDQALMLFDDGLEVGDQPCDAIDRPAATLNLSVAAAVSPAESVISPSAATFWATCSAVSFVITTVPDVAVFVTPTNESTVPIVSRPPALLSI